MFRWLPLLLLSILSSACHGKGLDRWDAMPAVDVLHLTGPYADQRVCPMCRHGFDAGVLVFLPASTSTSQFRQFSQRLARATGNIAEPRFRRFLILTGDRPTAEQLAAFSDGAWYVAWLEDSEQPKASADYRWPLADHAWAAVFSQRRMLWRFDPLADDEFEDSLSAHSNYAMQFLDANSSDGADAHGRLWTAPNRIEHAADLRAASPAATGRVCLETNGDPLANALIHAAITPNAKRGAWARSDKSGCIELYGISAESTISLDVFQPPAVMQTLLLEHTDLNSTVPLSLAVDYVALQHTISETIVGLPCDGCDTVFHGMPQRILTSARIAAADETGEALRITGLVRGEDGRPTPGVIIYAYQTNAAGHYPPAGHADGTANRHGALRGWVKTDQRGRYRFDTIRPGAYPGRDTPQHVHMQIIEPGRCTYYISNLLFDDDPRLTAGDRSRAESARGGNGIAVPLRQSGHWLVQRDIELGLHVNGYKRCGSDQLTATHEGRVATP